MLVFAFTILVALFLLNKRFVRHHGQP